MENLKKKVKRILRTQHNNNAAFFFSSRYDYTKKKQIMTSLHIRGGLYGLLQYTISRVTFTKTISTLLIPKLSWTPLGCLTTFTAYCLPRGMARGFWSVVVSPAGRSQILKSSIPEDSHPNGGGNAVKVTLRLSSSCGEGCTNRMHQSGHHTAAEWRIIKMLLCEREVTAEERTGLGHFF